jgi:GT2 family glycosyltransferase
MGMLTARVNAYPSVSATTEYLLFLDADDLIAPEMLERMVGYLDVHPEVGMAHCKDNLIDQNNLPTASEDRVTCRCVPGGGFLKNVPDTVPLTAPESLAWWSPVIPSTSLIRRTVYEEVGGWDEPLRYGHEDADLFLRISLKYPVHLVPEVLTSYRLHPAQMTKKHLFLQREHLQFHKKWLRGAHLNKEDRHWFRRTWLLYEAWLAPQFFLRCSAKKLASGDIIGSAVCFARIWKHYAMVLTAPAREILW